MKEIPEIPRYPKGDLRRMLLVLAAIDELPAATLVRIAEKTMLDKKTITSLISQARTQASVSVEKNGSVYSLVDWGPIIKRSGAKMALTGAFNAPTMEA